MPRDLSKAVTIRRRSAAHGCATAHPDARSARGGRDDQVDVGFGQDSGVNRGFRANNRAKNILIHTYSTPGNSPVTWVSGAAPGEPLTGVYGSGTGVNLL